MIPRATIPIFHYGKKKKKKKSGCRQSVRGSACVLGRRCNRQWIRCNPCSGPVGSLMQKCESRHILAAGQPCLLASWQSVKHKLTLCLLQHTMSWHTACILRYSGLTVPPSLTTLSLRESEICTSEFPLTNLHSSFLITLKERAS